MFRFAIVDILCTKDYTNEEAVAWWVSVPLSGPNAGELIDGVLADNSAFGVHPNISETRLEALQQAKLAMIGKLQAEFDKVGRGGVVFGNGLNEYDQSPTDPHDFDILEHVAGIQNEHYAVFEQVRSPATPPQPVPVFTCQFGMS